MGNDVVVIASITLLQFATVFAGPLSRFSRGASDGRAGNETITGCSLGDLVYLPGDAVPGRSICETCVCGEDGAVRCTKAVCQTKPGCKALHTPDACCPTYQCECEKDGRMYANGERLIDSEVPCRVCYCQGGEVVCRHIACFKRDDCEPRKVQGKCCPEYDHCPIRGASVTSLPTEPVTFSTFETPFTRQFFNTSSEASVSSTLDNLDSGIRIKEILEKDAQKASAESTKMPASSREMELETKKPAPVIKVGDQLLIIAPAEVDLKKLGISTPGSIITVVGAEGLQRGDMDEATTITVDVQKTTAKLQESSSAQDGVSVESAQDLQATKYSQTTISPDLETKGYEITSNTEKPTQPKQLATELSGQVQEKTQPSEDEENLMPEHNPEFPPIPDDLSAVENIEEDSSETDHDVPESDNIVIVKRPVFSITNLELSSVVSENTRKLPIDEQTEKAVPTIQVPFEETTMQKLEDLSFAQTPGLEITDEPETLTEFVTDVIATEQPNVSFSQTNAAPVEIAPESGENMENNHFEVIKESYFLETTPKTKEITTSQSRSSVETTSSEKSKAGEVLPIFKVDTEKSFGNVSPIRMRSDIDHKPTSDINSFESLTSYPQFTATSVLPIVLDSVQLKDLKTSNVPARDMIPTLMTTSKETPQEKDKIDAMIVPNHNLSSTESKESIEEIIFNSPITTTSTQATEQLTSTKAFDLSHEALIEQPKHKNVLSVLINLVGDVASLDEGDKGNFKIKSSKEENASAVPKLNAVSNEKKTHGGKNDISIPTKEPNSTKFTELIESEDDSLPEHAINNKVEPTTRRPIIDNVSDDSATNMKPNPEIEIINKVYVPTLKKPSKITKKSDEKSEASDSSEEDLSKEMEELPAEHASNEQNSEHLKSLTSLESSTMLN